MLGFDRPVLSSPVWFRSDCGIEKINSCLLISVDASVHHEQHISRWKAFWVNLIWNSEMYYATVSRINKTRIGPGRNLIFPLISLSNGGGQTIFAKNISVQVFYTGFTLAFHNYTSLPIAAVGIAAKIAFSAFDSQWCHFLWGWFFGFRRGGTCTVSFSHLAWSGRLCLPIFVFLCVHHCL